MAERAGMPNYEIVGGYAKLQWEGIPNYGMWKGMLNYSIVGVQAMARQEDMLNYGMLVGYAKLQNSGRECQPMAWWEGMPNYGMVGMVGEYANFGMVGV